MPSSGYSSTSTWVMQSWASRAAAPPMSRGRSRRGAGRPGSPPPTGCPWPASRTTRPRPGNAPRRNPSGPRWWARRSRTGSRRVSWPVPRNRRRDHACRRAVARPRPPVGRSWRRRCRAPRRAGPTATTGSGSGTGTVRRGFVHRPVQVDADHPRFGLGVGVRGIGQILGRVGFELLEEDALRRHLAERLPVGRAGHRDRDRAARTVPGPPDHPGVIAEVLATELGADPDSPGELEYLLLGFQITEAVTKQRAFLRQRSR